MSQRACDYIADRDPYASVVREIMRARGEWPPESAPAPTCAMCGLDLGECNGEEDCTKDYSAWTSGRMR